MPESPKVFISYAHSTAAHRARVADLAATLRAHGLTVLIDTDVRTPQGPPEGWPKWMKYQIKAADWVLMFFDDVYRRRFDGEEAPDTGLGATWEGAILTHQLYRQSAKNTRFIPLLADDARTQLIPDELAGATYYRIPKQSDQLATALAQTVGGKDGPAGPASAQAVSAAIAPTRLRRGAERLFGRESELAALDEAWNNPARHVLTIVAWGGVGTTSLVAEWMARQSAAGWPGFERVFDWSFYSQGTREQGAASADTFIAAALKFFGDEEMANSPASPWDKGARLAQLVAQRRTLLVLDGVEPLQYPPGPLGGQLKDPALEALLKGLAQRNPGLCIVTTREGVTDVTRFRDTTAPEWNLENLNDEAGAALLHQAGANRAGPVSIKPDDDELKAASREVAGHALTLRLLGTYLGKAHQGDIRKRDQVKFTKADAKTQGGHAFRTIAAYEKWFAGAGEDGARALALLRLLGLFDRPADAGCLAALRKRPAIPGLTEPLLDIAEEDWNLAVSSLEECGLLSAGRRAELAICYSAFETPLDAHPLIREYFAQQLRNRNPKAWRAAHRRLYEHLTTTTKDKPQPTLEDLQPLYQAIAHGCQASMRLPAFAWVLRERIMRNLSPVDELLHNWLDYDIRILGAVGANLGAVACFFEMPWTHVSTELNERDRAWLLSQASSDLRALGRLAEAREPTRASLDYTIQCGDWKNAAIDARNLSELELLLGQVAAAVRHAEKSMAYADRSGDFRERFLAIAAVAEALHQGGRSDDASAYFGEAEAMQARCDRDHPLLYSGRGFRFCDLLLSDPERAAWRRFSNRDLERSRPEVLKACHLVEGRAARALEWVTPHNWLRDIALDHLTLGRAALYVAILDQSKIQNPIPARRDKIEAARRELTAAVDGLRHAAQQDDIPRGLLSRAWLRYLDGDAAGAQADLDEAWQIATRGPMRLHMADIHLYRARLFFREPSYAWYSPRADLAAARKLIEDCGYWRRKEELEDAERAIPA